MYQIDQSGKIEQTNRATFIALANGKTKIVKISSVEKRKLIKSISMLTQPHNTYIYGIFAALIFFLINDHEVKEVLIDTEYTGHNASIKEIIFQLFQKSQKEPPEIDFGFVGKKSSAHLAAISAFRKETKVDLVAKAGDILKILYGNLSIKKRLETPV